MSKKNLKSYIFPIPTGIVVSLIKFLQGKHDSFPLTIEYFRIGKARAFIDDISDDDLVIDWSVKELDMISDIFIRKQSDLTDGYVLNIDLDEDNLDRVRREFWNHLIWGGLPPHPLCIVVPEKRRVGTLSRVEVLSALNLIRLTDRPWEVFVNVEGVEDEVAAWLKLTCMTFDRGLVKKPLLKELSKGEKED